MLSKRLSASVVAVEPPDPCFILVVAQSAFALPQNEEGMIFVYSSQEAGIRNGLALFAVGLLNSCASIRAIDWSELVASVARSRTNYRLVLDYDGSDEPLKLLHLS